MVLKDALIIGLTGGIAAGKSTVAKLFAELGVEVIDTDQIAREVVQPGSKALLKLCEHFGEQYLDREGNLNRQKLATYVFSNPKERAWLESLLHPLIWEETKQRARNSTSSYSMIAVPLLLETRAWQGVDRVLVVDCPPELQLQRALARDGSKREQVEQVMAAQLPREERLKLADDMINNAETVENLRAQVLTLHRQYLELQL